MSILNVEHLSHGFGDRAIFQDVSFRLLKGEHIGLIGANGEGKSTFMNIITGKLMPDEGKVEWAKNVRVGYLDQHAVLEKGMTIRDVLKNAFAFLFEMEEHMNQICDKMGEAGEEEMAAMMDELGTIQDLLMAHDFYIIDSKVEEVGRALGLADIGLDKDVTELSGGQRTKVLLGKLLLEKPDILLLDEPTNYLDYTSRRKLYKLISETKATVIVVSHDITFLNLLEETYELSSKGIRQYGGNYDFYKTQKEIEEQALSRQISTAETALRLARKKAKETNERQEKRARQGEKKKDQVPRILRQGLKNKGEKTGAKLQDKHADIINRDNERLKDLRQKQNIVCELKLDFDNATLNKGKLLVAAHGINFQYEGKEFLWRQSIPDIEIWSGERIHINGDNGTGKTTLLKLLTGELQPSVGEIKRADFSFIYLDQEYSKVNTSQTLLELAQAYNRHHLLDHEIKLRLHRALFSQEMWDRPCRVLSGGERMRLYLCCLMISNHIPDVFILDEPTNNLDLLSLDILTTTLKNYQGTILLISHDKRFVEEIGITKVIGLNTHK